MVYQSLSQYAWSWLALVIELSLPFMKFRQEISLGECGDTVPSRDKQLLQQLQKMDEYQNCLLF